MIVYKVCRRIIKGDFYSCNTNGVACVQYKIGEISRPPEFLRKKHYGLLCFSSFDNAKRFAISSPIFKCYTKNCRKTLPRVLDIQYLSRGVIQETSSSWPLGTLMVPWLKPLELMR